MYRGSSVTCNILYGIIIAAADCLAPGAGDLFIFLQRASSTFSALILDEVDFHEPEVFPIFFEIHTFNDLSNAYHILNIRWCEFC